MILPTSGSEPLALRKCLKFFKEAD